MNTLFLTTPLLPPSDDDRDARGGRDCKDWERARSVLEHENTLINYRLTWNGVVQGIFAVLYSTVLVKIVEINYPTGHLTPSIPVLVKLCLCTPTLLVPCAAIGACLVIINTVNAANITSSRVEAWWYLRCAGGDVVEAWKLRSRTVDPRLGVSEQPPINGLLDDIPFRIMGTELLPHFFLWFWIIAEVVSLVLCFVVVLGPNLPDYGSNPIVIVLPMIVIFGAIAWFARIYLSQFNNSTYLRCELPDTGYDLFLFPKLGDVNNLGEESHARSGRGKVIVGMLDGRLYFRIFDAKNPEHVIYTIHESVEGLEGQASPIMDLLRQLSCLEGWEGYWYERQLRRSSGREAGPVLREMRYLSGRRSSDTLSPFEKSVLIAKVLAILDHARSPVPSG